MVTLYLGWKQRQRVFQESLTQGPSVYREIANQTERVKIANLHRSGAREE